MSVKMYLRENTVSHISIQGVENLIYMNMDFLKTDDCWQTMIILKNNLGLGLVKCSRFG